MSLNGQTISHYRILDKLGGGGMGVVYCAEDERLGRRVALKFLPEELSHDPAALERFQREARAASALNHPNICTIYDVDAALPSGAAAPVHFIAMELLDGRTLKACLEAKAFEPLRIVELACDLADALDAAHAKGILHRDIKPANLFLTERDEIKILDFGVAKLTGDGSAAPDLTGTGVVLGTPAYMSPEQVSGDELDARTDLFSLGTVLYEMAAGRPAFSGKSPVATCAAVLTQSPARLDTLKPDLPAELVRIVDKALAKNPGDRYQTAADLRADLKSLRRELDSGYLSASVAAQARSARTRWRAATLVAVVALLLSGFSAYRLITASADNVPMEVTRVSRWNRPIASAVLSPDGKAIAFTSPVSGVNQVFLMLTSGGEPLKLTGDSGDKRVEGFSPDGREIYFAQSDAEVHAVPLLGGPTVRVAPGGPMAPSPDGKTLYFVKDRTSEVYRAFRTAPSPNGVGTALSSTTGVGPRRLKEMTPHAMNWDGSHEELIHRFDSPPLHLSRLLVYPDGKRLLLSGTRSAGDARFELYELNVEDRSARTLGTVDCGPWQAPSVVWEVPGESLLIHRTVDGLTNLWRFRLRGRGLERVTVGAGQDTWPMPDPEGRGIYFVNARDMGSLVAYDVKTGATTEITSDAASQPLISPDGRRVSYVKLVEPGKNEEVWIADIDGKNGVKVVSAESAATGGWSPDGARIAYVTYGERSQAFTVTTDGRATTRLPPVDGTINNVVWSPDGAEVYLSSTVAGRGDVTYRASAAGTGVERVAQGCGAAVDVFPDGTHILSVVATSDAGGVYTLALDTRRCTQLVPRVTTYNVRVGAKNDSILYAVPSEGEMVFHRHPLIASSRAELALRIPVSFPEAYQGTAYDFSRDLKTVVYARPFPQADIYLLHPASR